MSDEKVFCGSGKEKFNGNLIEVTLCVSDLPKDKIFEYNGRKYIKLKVQKMREPKDNGKTHFVEVDMFVPQKKEESPSAPPPPTQQEQAEAAKDYGQQKQDNRKNQPQQPNPNEADDLPFG
jgi:hypothetical protein